MAKSLELWRTFCAIELSQRVRDRAKEHISKLRNSFPDVRASWTRDDKFHLTLKFLGDTPIARVETLSHAAKLAAASRTSFKLLIEDAGAFPQRGPAKVLWLGVKDTSGALNDLHLHLEEECAKQGFGREDRPFHPHLTLARLRGSTEARPLAAHHKEMGFPGVEVLVSELLVIRSELSNAGSTYTVISRHSLTGSAGVPPA